VTAAPQTARAVSPLRNRNFALVWTSGLISDTGDWLLMIALPLFAFAITGSALGTSTVFIAELLPVLLFGSLFGVLVDRWDHRTTMVVINLLQGLALLPLIFANEDRLWIVYLVAAVEAALAAGLNPAKQSLLPQLVAADQLGPANSLMAVSENVSRFVGSPLGGLVFTVWGLPGVVILDAASYLLSAVLVGVSRSNAVQNPVDHSAHPRPVGLWRQWAEGFAIIRRTRPLGAILTITAVGSAAQGIFLVLFVVYVVRVLQASDAEVGLLRGVQAIGGILGGILVGILIRRMSNRMLVGYGYLAFGAIALLTWNFWPLSTATPYYAGFFIAMGIPAVAASAGIMTTVQLVAPPGSLGRIVATIQTAAQAAQGVGLLAAGILADRFGVVAILDTQAALYLLCGILALALFSAPKRTEAHVAASTTT
jgi:predicted MFS family arabinose efflux permease